MASHLVQALAKINRTPGVTLLSRFVVRATLLAAPHKLAIYEGIVMRIIVRGNSQGPDFARVSFFALEITSESLWDRRKYFQSEVLNMSTERDQNSSRTQNWEMLPQEGPQALKNESMRASHR